MASGRQSTVRGGKSTRGIDAPPPTAVRVGAGEAAAWTGTCSCGTSACRSPCTCGSLGMSGLTSLCACLRRPALLYYFALPSGRDSMCRLVGYAVAGAAQSLMHAKCTKYRRFSPLRGMRGVNVHRPDLPPFLPSEEGGWAGLGIDDGSSGGKAMAGKTDPARVMAASLSDWGGNTPGQPGGRKGGSNATAIMNTPHKVPPSRGTVAKPATEEASNVDGREGEGGGEGDDNSHHHPMWESSIYRTWLEGSNVRTTQYAKQCCAQASDRLLTLRKMTTLSLAVTNSTSLVSLLSSKSLKSSSSASPPPPTGGGNTTNRVGYALVTGASS